MRKYSFADHPKHQARLAEHHEKWLHVPFDCTPMTDDDRVMCADAVREMYRIAKISVEPRVVFAPSPFVAQIAAGFAAAIWHLRSHPDATLAATVAATDDATRAATFAATDDATEATFFFRCAASAWRLRNGGNMWSGWVEYLAFFRDVAGLPIDWTAFAPYETLGQKAGPRYLHDRFCIISEKPEYIKGYWRNGRFVAHRDDGPSHRWRDGSAVYFWHGTHVGWRFGNRTGGHPEWIDRPESITAAAITAENNTELRRVMIALFGERRYAMEIGATIRHQDELGTLWEAPRKGDTPIVLLQCPNGTPEPIDYVPRDGEAGEWVGKRWVKHYWLRVRPDCRTTREAEAWLYGLAKAEDYAPEART